MKKTIIFDVDGTLLDTERIYMDAWRQAGALFGYNITDEALLNTRAVSAATAIPIFKACCGEDFTYSLVRNERVRIAEEIIAASMPEQLLKAHTKETLDILREQGYTMAVASSTKHATTQEHLAHAGLLEYFTAVVGGDMVEKGKPEPDIFLLAASLCGSDPKACIVVGDTPADVLAGSAAGMEVYLIPDQVPANPQTTALSRRVLNHLGELLEVL